MLLTATEPVESFIYANGLRLTLLSLAWAVTSLPLVTIGPATLATYIAIQDLRSDRNRIDFDRIRTTLQKYGLASALFSGVPVAFGTVAVTYGVTTLREGSLVGEVVALLASYVALYVALALMPTYVALARGSDPVRAFRYGIGWLVSHPTPALAVGLLSVFVHVITTLMTVGFVLVFAEITFSLQVAVVETVDEEVDGVTVTTTAASV